MILTEFSYTFIFCHIDLVMIVCLIYVFSILTDDFHSMVDVDNEVTCYNHK